MKYITSTARFLWELARIVIISLVIIIPIRYFVVQPFIVRGASMEPNFENSEYLIIDELSYRFRDPERGEVIVFRFPENPSQYYIKRIIALPGETVEFREGRVYITSSDGNATLLDESAYLARSEVSGDLKTPLDDSEYFVLGDNRNASSDSRRWGPLKEKFIVGRVLVRAWPFDRAALFLERPTY